jgi:CubicO group peptidase (beta-lactamase class C family)
VPWDFPAGVRVTLPDMVRYLEGQLGTITRALARTQQEVARVSGHTMGMNWEMLSNAKIANGRTIVMHGGHTGGYSSFVAFDRAAKRAVVLLSDTSLVTVGGLGQLALHLLDHPSAPAGEPRIAATADAKLFVQGIGRREQQLLALTLFHTVNDACSYRASWQAVRRNLGKDLFVRHKRRPPIAIAGDDG